MNDLETQLNATIKRLIKEREDLEECLQRVRVDSAEFEQQVNLSASILWQSSVEAQRLKNLIGYPPEGSHPDEWQPRALTWHEERLNWISEVQSLRNQIGPTPNASLPPLGEGPRRKMVIEIEVTEDFEKRLDNQWMVEREIHADRWSWKWKEETDCPNCNSAPQVERKTT